MKLRVKPPATFLSVIALAHSVWPAGQLCPRRAPHTGPLVPGGDRGDAEEGGDARPLGDRETALGLCRHWFRWGLTPTFGMQPDAAANSHERVGVALLDFAHSCRYGALIASKSGGNEGATSWRKANWINFSWTIPSRSSTSARARPGVVSLRLAPCWAASSARTPGKSDSNGHV